jgi:hypothetical protein
MDWKDGAVVRQSGAGILDEADQQKSHDQETCKLVDERLVKFLCLRRPLEKLQLRSVDNFELESHTTESSSTHEYQPPVPCEMHRSVE